MHNVSWGIWLCLMVYGFILLFIFLYSLAQLHLTFIYLKSKNKNSNSAPLSNWPTVTIQLPVYNEPAVVQRLLDCVTAIDYPNHLIDFQILDDSTDPTTQIIKDYLSHSKFDNLKITHLTRAARTGYKAGALAYGLAFSKAEFVAIFDADFLPSPQFLLVTLPYFAQPAVGIVQTRWGHLNENFSILTQLQAFGLDGHFFIDQTGRTNAGLLSNFNGTAGVWRRSCIDAPGGWSADCLTEDLDLSYRAQLIGWQVKYLVDFESKGELPVELQAIKNQQFRWAKGAAEVARKLLFQVFTSKKIIFKQKVHALFHLCNSFAYPAILFMIAMVMPLMYWQKTYPILSRYLQAGLYLQTGFIFLSIYFWVAHAQNHNNKWTFFYKFPLFLALMIGLSLYNGIGVMAGYFGIKSEFVRTPKYNIIQATRFSNAFKNNSISFYFLAELLVLIYSIFCFVWAIEHQFWLSLPFISFVILGYFLVVFYQIKHSFFNSQIAQ